MLYETKKHSYTFMGQQYLANFPGAIGIAIVGIDTVPQYLQQFLQNTSIDDVATRLFTSTEEAKH